MKRIHFASDACLAFCIAAVLASVTLVSHGTIQVGSGPWSVLLVVAVVSLLTYSVIAISGMRWKDNKVDIWEYQAALHRVSGQARPDVPVLTRDSLLYVALIAEEFSEKCATLREILNTPSSARSRYVYPASLLRYMDYLQDLQKSSKSNSEWLRKHVAELPVGWCAAISNAEAAALLDDNNDISVVNAGFAIATGLPAREGYVEVGESNLSKVNPDTGVIDKDAGGKWIKGRNYRKPNLLRVIEDATIPDDFYPN